VKKGILYIHHQMPPPPPPPAFLGLNMIIFFNLLPENDSSTPLGLNKRGNMERDSHLE